MLAALKPAGDLTEDEKKETISRLLEEIVALKMVGMLFFEYVK